MVLVRRVPELGVSRDGTSRQLRAKTWGLAHSMHRDQEVFERPLREHADRQLGATAATLTKTRVLIWALDADTVSWRRAQEKNSGFSQLEGTYSSWAR